MTDMPPPPPDDRGSAQPPPAPGGQAYNNPQAVTGWANLGVGGTVELGSPWSRLGGRILDSLIVGVPAIIIFMVMAAAAFGDDADSVTQEDVETFLGGSIVLLATWGILGVIYEVAMIAKKGQTLGKMATRIKVVRADNGNVPGWGKSLGRWLVPSIFSMLGMLIPFVGLVALLVYVSLTWDRARQGWHDKAASTLVIKV